MTTDSERRFADLAMKAANQRTHQLIALAASQARIAALEFDISARVAGQRSDHERIAALEAALTRWTTADGGTGLHLDGCAYAQGDACTCGLDDAQALLEEKP